MLRYSLCLLALVFAVLGCGHRLEYKMGQKMAATEEHNDGVVANINFTKYRKDAVHFLITLQNFYPQDIEIPPQSFTFKYNGIQGTISKNEFPQMLNPGITAKRLLIFKFPAELPKQGKGELTIEPLAKDGKKISALKFEFDYDVK